jgi:predicted small secreted protein
MRRLPTALVLVAVVLAACSTPEGSSRPPEIGMDVRFSGSPAATSPPTGMDGRPVGIATAASEAPDRTGLSGGEPPPPWEGRGGRGPTGPPAAIVPDVRGLSFAGAVRLLWRAGIDFDLVNARTSDEPRWSVLAQAPAPGSDTPDSGKINLILAMPPSGSGEGAYTTVRCRPVPQRLSNPYCVGKLLKY